MCLSKITRRLSRPTKRERTAYKLYRQNAYYPEKLFGLYRTMNGDALSDAPFVRGQWLRASRRRVVCNLSPEQYMTGFHVFPTSVDAEEYRDRYFYLSESVVIVPVRVRGIRIEGEEISGSDTWIVDEMYIPTPEELETPTPTPTPTVNAVQETE